MTLVKKPECCDGEGGGHNGAEDPRYNMHTSHMLHTWNGEVQCRSDMLICCCGTEISIFRILSSFYFRQYSVSSLSSMYAM